MTSGNSMWGTLLKWTLVLAVGAALGGYIVFMFQTPRVPPLHQAGEDPSDIKPGSDSNAPAVVTNEPSVDDPLPKTNESTRAPAGDDSTVDPGAGPDVDISVKPVAAGAALPPGTTPIPKAERKHRRRKRIEPTHPKVDAEAAQAGDKPPAETFLPDRGSAGGGGGDASTGGSTTTGGSGTGGGTTTTGGGQTTAGDTGNH